LQPFASWKCEFSPFTNDSVPFRRRFAQQGSSFASRQKRRRFLTPTGGVVFPSSFFYWTDFVSDINANTKDNSFALLTEDGKSNKYLGDGVMAFFGYPEAHDNDAERAARAGLATLGVSIV
jgi:class 3 adenylate cyclase